jgi:hypothetical protein
VLAASRWLGGLSEEQICLIPKGDDIAERLRLADQVLATGSNAGEISAAFRTEQGNAVARILRMGQLPQGTWP